MFAHVGAMKVYLRTHVGMPVLIESKGKTYRSAHVANPLVGSNNLNIWAHDDISGPLPSRRFSVRRKRPSSAGESKGEAHHS
jgi:hypothetical protein